MMYLVKVRHEGARSVFYRYYVVQDARDEDHACDLVIMQTGDFLFQMSAQPLPPVFKIAKSTRHGVYDPQEAQ